MVLLNDLHLTRQLAYGFQPDGGIESDDDHWKGKMKWKVEENHHHQVWELNVGLALSDALTGFMIGGFLKETMFNP